MSEIKPKSIIYYQGGGYDGCIWEPNFAWYDGDKIYNLLSTGSLGLFRNLGGKPQDSDCYPQALKDFQDPEWVKDNDVRAYTLDRLADLRSEVRSDMVLFCVKQLAELQESYTQDLGIDTDILGFRCDECQNWFSVHELETDQDSYYGCGGIAMACDRLVCSGCQGMQSCECCDSRFQPATSCYDEVHQHGNSMVCDTCIIDILAQSAPAREILKAMRAGSVVLHKYCDCFAADSGVRAQAWKQHSVGMNRLGEELDHIIFAYIQAHHD
jgi:hypothetical protein